MVRYTISGSLGPRLSFATAVLALLVGSLGLGGCAGTPVPRGAVADSRPMVAPQPPPSSPDFNVKSAKPLPTPAVPVFEPLPVPSPPPPPVAMAPLDAPSPTSFEAMPPLPAPTPPIQRDKPIPRPSGPIADTVTPLEASAVQQTATLPTMSRGATGGDAASGPRGAVGIAGAPFRLEFAAESVDVPPTASAIFAKIVTAMAADPRLRLKLQSFASGPADDPVVARKVSLQRALKVRAALGEQGINSIRVDVLALGAGAGAEAGPADRIDLVPGE